MCARRQRMAEAVRRECRVATEVVGERLDRVRRAALEALAERELVDRVVGMDQVGEQLCQLHDAIHCAPAYPPRQRCRSRCLDRDDRIRERVGR